MKIEYLLALGVSLVTTLVVMPLFIPFLHKVRFGQSIRKEGPQSHIARAGTPTMEGLVSVSVPALAMLVLDYKAFFSGEMLVCVLTYSDYALIGSIGDFLIVAKKNNDGLRPSVKFLMQSMLAVVLYLFYRSVTEATLILPVVHVSLELKALYSVLVFFMFTCESNAVNLTDGLNDLYAGTSIIAIMPSMIFTLLQGDRDLVTLFLTICGSLFGYLRFSVCLIEILMGNTGSLTISSLLATSAMTLRQELLLVVIDGVFVMGLLSVVVQVTSCKATKKQVFRIVPLHHHFELGNAKRTQMVLMFWNIGVILAALSLWLEVMQYGGTCTDN